MVTFVLGLLCGAAVMVLPVLLADGWQFRLAQWRGRRTIRRARNTRTSR